MPKAVDTGARLNGCGVDRPNSRTSSAAMETQSAEMTSASINSSTDIAAFLNGALAGGALAVGELEARARAAIKQAVSLFLWDSLRKSPKRAPGARRLGQIAAKGAKR
jgi:hypothetical protein